MLMFVDLNGNTSGVSVYRQLERAILPLARHRSKVGISECMLTRARRNLEKTFQFSPTLAAIISFTFETAFPERFHEQTAEKSSQSRPC